MTPERYRKAGEILPRRARPAAGASHGVSRAGLRRRRRSAQRGRIAPRGTRAGGAVHRGAAPSTWAPCCSRCSIARRTRARSRCDRRSDCLDVRHEPSLTPGQQLGRYEVLDLLGAGGMGSVYRALDPSLGREVAIKALARTFRGDSTSLRRFEREARVLATLSHPNIATIYGFEHLDGSPYLVLERVDGETLASRLRRGAHAVDEALARCRADRRGARRGTRQGRDPSRPETVERHADAGRPRQARRLRPRQDDASRARARRLGGPDHRRQASSSAPRAT